MGLERSQSFMTLCFMALPEISAARNEKVLRLWEDIFYGATSQPEELVFD